MYLNENYPTSLQRLCTVCLPVTNYIYWGFFKLKMSQRGREREREKSFVVVEAEGCLLRVCVIHYCHGMTMEKLTAEPSQTPINP